MNERHHAAPARAARPAPAAHPGRLPAPESDDDAPTIRVSAVLVTDGTGRALMVRKHGTERFMQPGGKPEPGERAAETAARELGEELGIHVLPSQLRPLGTHRAAAANEPGHTVIADAFALEVNPVDVQPLAEIAEARWITPADDVPLAPLSAEVLLPLIWG